MERGNACGKPMWKESGGDSTKCVFSVKALEHDSLSANEPTLANRLHCPLIYADTSLGVAEDGLSHIH